MIQEDQWAAIQNLRAQGHSKKAIARALGIDVRVVRKYLKRGGWAPYKRHKERPSLIEPYRGYLVERMPQVRYNAQVLFVEIRGKGYPGSYEPVKRFLRPFREERLRLEEATVRFETGPGEQAQVDWGSSKILIGGKPERVSIFVMVLGFSRRVFAVATRDEKVATLIDCHQRAFEHFGGRTRTLLFDNPKTVCLGREGGRVTLNPVFEDFARYWGFTVRLCQPYRARTKGKVESGVKYVKGNFLVGKAFDSLEHLNQGLLRWCVEVAD